MAARTTILAGFALLLASGPGQAERVVKPIDPRRTQIHFTVDAVGWPRTEGTFKAFTGRLAVDFDHPARSSVTFEVSAASVNTGSSALDDLLRGSAFFDAQRHPTITFNSTEVVKTSERTVQVTGELTLVGVRRPVTLTVDVDRGKGRNLGFRASGTLQRAQFGMVTGLPLISNDVALLVATEVPAE
jgi:polyisoprenoid-binding protein YceI